MNYNFENIAGYETEKAELKRLCDIFNNRAKYEQKGAKLPKGIIFYGEPGTGKTLFSKVMASVCGLEVFKIDLGDVENESAICRHIKKTFIKAAKRKEPTMIFFDEMDKVLPNDNEDYYTDRSKTILTQLLTLIDGMDSAKNIVFVATCNDYDALPETLTRPGRLDKKIGIGAPSYSSRVEILKMYAKRSSCRFEMSMEDIAKICSGFTCAALETLINDCILQSLFLLHLRVRRADVGSCEQSCLATLSEGPLGVSEFPKRRTSVLAIIFQLASLQALFLLFL